MNKYQYIKLSKNDNFGKGKIESIDITEMSKPNSLDLYQVNVINFNNHCFWKKIQSNIHWIKFNDTSTYSEYTNDYVSLVKMINDSSKSTICIILPQNISIKFRKLKNQLEIVNNIIFQTILNVHCFTHDIKMVFEPTDTKINNKRVHADFYLKGRFDFEYSDECSSFLPMPPKSITSSIISEKVTTVRYENFIFTTLDVGENFESFIDFYNNIGQDETYSLEMLDEITFFNDKKLLSEKHEIESQLEYNRKIKSILFTSGDELVSGVFEILKVILDCNDELDNFEDKKEEDFVIRKSDITFIGEIKGVKTNVNSKHVDQTNKHYTKYVKMNKEESSKGILIINHQRLTHLNERQNIHNEQIKIAESYGCLIVETKILLKLYEEYLNKNLNSANCIELFSSKVGVLKESDFMHT